MKINFLFFFLFFLFFLSCKNRPVNFNPDNVEILHNNENKLTEIIIYDIFSPPVASRIYAYTSLAQYEAVRFIKPDAPSFAANLNEFSPMPVPEKNKEYNFILAGTKAFCTVAYNVRIFSDTTLHRYEDSLYTLYMAVLPADVYKNSIAFGDSIGKIILKRAAKDMYKETRGMPKYLGSKDDGKWQPTAPDYLEAAEPYWKKMHAFALDTCSQFRPVSPLSFNKDSANGFYKMVKEVYTIGKNLSDSQKTIARFWDDNPFVMEHSGHLMFANKKITPGGHWMGITAIAGRKANADAVKTAQAYALTSMALLDAFISCWDAKYTYAYVRPVTLINQWMDENWVSFLQTPAFPEYTSAHSTISGAASVVLTYMFGDNFSFLDNSDEPYIGITRQFSSFYQAAAEASISRLYGGIHYRNSVDTGLVKGKLIGANVLKKLKLQ
ncbi:MAG: vanadium-dependent haloperoxidase [Parafilimonas sp.]